MALPMPVAALGQGARTAAGVATTEGAAGRTYLDDLGRWIGGGRGEPVNWKRELHAGTVVGAEAARVHVALGEWELGEKQNPAGAVNHFHTAQRLTPLKSETYGLAAYDTALARFYEGDYSGAAAAFKTLLDLNTALPGYSRRTCALWYRRACACAGVHRDHAALGIPEPAILDPLAGSAALAACLRGLGLPSDRSSVLKVVRHTGEGSSLEDLWEAVTRCRTTSSGRTATGAGTLGGVVAPFCVSADEAGLMALPKPLVAYVEHDHFVAVTRADKAGVGYLCSDCGPWPGGQVNLTWRQWRAMEAGPFLVVTRKGCAEARAISRALSGRAEAGVRIAMQGPLARLRVADAIVVARIASSLAHHISLYLPNYLPLNGSKPDALHCSSMTPCPMDDGPC
ncbi:MAG TPA: hypothetical protein VGS41_12030, partial [Chthonomonadales bacterium]|nr:hypothetical protein [Chthonomonadales bacterium]